MEKIVHYFDNIPAWHRSVILVAGLCFFWTLEGIFPLFRFSYNKIRHAGINLLFTLTTLVVNFCLAYGIVWGSRYSQSHHSGLLELLAAPRWIRLMLGLLLLDFIGAWLIHWIEHKLKWLWKFHLVHHTDTWIDTTSANRHHPGESILRASFTLLAVLITGAPIWLVYCYQTLSISCSQFNHANISLPEKLDKALRWIIVSPNMHKIHHHFTQPLTDTNYGNIFSCWDRLFGTYASVKDINSLHYGIDTHMGEKENNHAARLFKMPFEPFRPAPGSKFGRRG